MAHSSMPYALISQFFRDLADVASITIAKPLKSAKKRAVYRTIFKKHGKFFKAKSAEVKQRLEIRARARVSARIEELAEKRMELMSQILEQQIKIETSRSKRPPITLSSAQLTDSNVANLEARFQSHAVNPGELLRRRDATCRAPDGMSSRLLSALDEQELVETPSPPRPEWASVVAKHRDDFGDVVFLIERDGHSEVLGV